ncbi:feruloyl-CoA synthase [Chelativorans salis]|uniref:Feruloyl-CoA synthase n=1 Tax=Chelativorans salis TaxID=2978478 RepID=A0ABT2LRD2_9HYPH|nr:feruloyl-CoA synthase [Chelativorans sp. EGI FJ00035]MCT7377105.1 feruloyl-CoA synthase [Chelativorans sp. EGI FJ00035]
MSAMVSSPFRDVPFGNLDITLERRDDGAIFVTPVNTLPDYAPSMCDCLEKWAVERPDKVFMAERQGEGWRKIRYRETLAAVRRLGAALLPFELSEERPLAILSGNGIDHALIALAAMYIGVPHAPLSPAYSLVSTDHGKLKHIFKLITPGLVFVADGAAFSKALDAVWPADAPTVFTRSAPEGREAIPLYTLCDTEPDAALDRAREKVQPDSIAKFLMTSGSTGGPKAVITTQRMLTANQEMLRYALTFLKDGPTIIDWLPWNHTFGGNHNIGLVLYNGGSLYIDDGLPTPAGISATVKNLREIAPSIYFNVPKGYEALVPFLKEDKVLRDHFFSRVQALFFAGAGLSPHVWNALDELAVASIGARIPILTGLGATETAPFSLSCTPYTAASGRVGVPVPGNRLKLFPVDGKLEARVKGPNVTPGYWREPDKTANAFDEEGFYRFGDALKFVDENRPEEGFFFDGRISEDFKLASGTWVSVGPLRARIIAHAAPLVRDVVLAAINRDYLTALIIVDPQECRLLAGDLLADAPLAEIVGHPAVRGALQAHLDSLAKLPGGSSTRVMRAILLDTPPSIDAGEVTDKGSINQRAVLEHRAADVEALYAEPPDGRVLVVNV